MKLRMMSQEAAPKEAANSELRRYLAYSKPFNRGDVEIGDWRGPAKALVFDVARRARRNLQGARCCTWDIDVA